MLESLIDLTDHTSVKRPERVYTDAVICHRIKHGKDVPDIIDFFKHHPHGVAAVTLSGSWSSKVPTIKEWEKNGVPESYSNRSFVGYNIIVDTSGQAYELLPVEAKGAHAGNWNGHAVGVAFVGDFRTERQLAEWESKAGMGGDHLSENQVHTARRLLFSLKHKYPDAEIFTHDDSRRADQGEVKHCPGELAEPLIHELSHWVNTAFSLSQGGVP